MKSIEFGEDQLADLQSLAQQLFDDCSDPRCRGYHRVLIRPRIRWWKILLWCFGVLLAAVSLGFGAYHLGLGLAAAILIPMGLTLLTVLLLGKRILICLVRIYQRYAPDAIRNKCRFEPSCSQYMILSLEKYGLWKGLARGIGRLKRCNIDNGGFDEP